MKQFTFPLAFQDLQRHESYTYTNYNVANDGYKKIKDMYQNVILQTIKRTNKSVYNDVTIFIQNDCFDFFYFLIKGFNQNIEFKSVRVLQQLCQSIQHILSSVLKECQDFNNCRNLENLRISFKMIMFLTFFFLSSSLVKKKMGDIVSQAINKQANKNKKNRKNNVQSQYTKTIVDKQKKILKIIRKTLQIDFVVLWQKNEVDQQFFKYYTDVAVKMLQSTIAKDSEIRQIIFSIFQIILKAKPQILKQIQVNLVNLIYQGDIIENLIQFFSKAQTAELQNLCRETTVLTVSFLTQKTNNQNTESQAIKNTKQFLSKLSDLIPKTFYNNLSCYIKLYDNQSYLLRNAITDILANIIRKVLINESEQNTKTKEKFINTLLQRIYDKNSHCRCHVLGILAQLSQQNVIPKNLIIHLLKAGIDRLKDSSVNTRKRAIQLISNILKIYYFLFCKEGQKLKSIEQLNKQLLILEQEISNLEKQIQMNKENLRVSMDQETTQNLQKQIKLDTKKLNQNLNMKQFYTQQKEVLHLIKSMTQIITVLLNSKNFSDVVQVIKLFIFLKQVGIHNIQNSVSKIRMLVFSKQKQVKQQVLNCFVTLYLENANQSAKNLIELFNQATLQDQTCLQEIIEILISEGKKKKQEFIDREVYQIVWNKFIENVRKNSNDFEKRACLKILRIFFNSDQNLLKQNYLISLLEILKKYVEQKNPDYLITRQIAKIIQKCPEKLGNNLKNFIVAELYIIINGQGTQQPQWYSAAQQILTTVYTICESPQKYSQLIISQMHSKLTNKPSETSLSQFIYLLSHSCLKLLIYVDSLQSKLKKIKQNLQNESNKQKQQQLDKIMGGIERQFELRFEKLQKLAQNIIEDQFIAHWLKIIENIVKKVSNGTQLQRVAVLAFCKFMCISQKYCQNNLQLLFNILTRPNMDYVIKNNIIIAIGDLLHRFPNTVQPHKKYLYQNLHDPNPRVRKATMTVLSHLILNDMIKIKGQICDIALLFEDDNYELQSLAKQFFNEINKKDPRFIYGQLPQAITRLSNLQQGLFGKKITQKSFECFAKNILGLLQKDKYSQNLIQKLCQRFSVSLNPIDLRNTSFCLSQLNINQKGLRKILQNFQLIREKLHDTQIMNSFKNLLNKLKKNHKPELKSLLQEFQTKLNNFSDEIFNLQNAKKKSQKLAKNKKKIIRKDKKNKTEDKMEQQENSQVNQNTQRMRTRLKKQNHPIVIQSSQNQNSQSEEYSQQSEF